MRALVMDSADRKVNDIGDQPSLAYADGLPVNTYRATDSESIFPSYHRLENF